MKGFEDVNLSWQGETYTVPANEQLMLIAVIEDKLSDGTGAPAVAALMRDGGPGFARLAAAYGAALHHAGASVSPEEVYLSMQESFAGGEAEVAEKVQAAILGLLSIISPPVYRDLMGVAKPGKKSETKQKKAS